VDRPSRVAQAKHRAAEDERARSPHGDYPEALPRGERQGLQPGRGHAVQAAAAESRTTVVTPRPSTATSMRYSAAPHAARHMVPLARSNPCAAVNLCPGRTSHPANIEAPTATATGEADPGRILAHSARIARLTRPSGSA